MTILKLFVVAVLVIHAASIKVNDRTGLTHKNEKGTEMKGDNTDRDSNQLSEKSKAMIASGKIFGYVREKKANTGQVIVKVSKTAIMITMGPDEQKKKWYGLNDRQFPFKQGGFDQWRFTRTGLVFRTDDGKSTVHCRSSKHTGNKQNVIFHFHCDPKISKYAKHPRFVQTGSSLTRPEVHSQDNENDSDGSNKANPDIFNDPSMNSNYPSNGYYYWYPTIEKCPYGWGNYWDDFTYNYWAMGPDGYYGCNQLTNADWCPEDYPYCACAARVAFFPYTNCDGEDCTPVETDPDDYAGDYGSYYLPYCEDCPYVQPKYPVNAYAPNPPSDSDDSNPEYSDSNSYCPECADGRTWTTYTLEPNNSTNFQKK